MEESKEVVGKEREKKGTVAKTVLFITIILCAVGMVSMVGNFTNNIKYTELQNFMEKEYTQSTEYNELVASTVESFYNAYHLDSQGKKEEAQSYLKENVRLQGLAYTVDDVFVSTNPPTNKTIKDYKAYVIIENGMRQIYPEIEESQYRVSSTIYNYPDLKKMMIGFTEGYLEEDKTAWLEAKAVVDQKMTYIKDYPYIAAGLFLLGLLSFIGLISKVGRRPGNRDKVYINSLGRIYNDIAVGIMVAVAAVSGATGYELINSMGVGREFGSLFTIVLILLVIVGGSILLGLFLNLVVHFKNKTLLKHTLIYGILSKLARFLIGISSQGAKGFIIYFSIVFFAVFMVACGIGLIYSAFPLVLILLGIVAASFVVYHRLRDYQQIKTGVDAILEGRKQKPIEVKLKVGEFANLANKIDKIHEGIQAEVEQRMKSERMKTELITNVSHDIRTPLTSIITYVDLMKKGGTKEEMGEYIKVIDTKSQRLKVLTDNLFEAAKASTGNLNVELQHIDLKALVNQGLGELDDKIEEARLEFRIVQPEEPVLVEADGRHLWRVIENIMNNAIKYALKGSRVYLQMSQEDQWTRLELKNISAEELNIPVEELMERFVRGSESRHTEGSGLGLSIAKSLMELQNGRFDMSIDGDLFKVTLLIPTAKQVTLEK